MAKSWQLQDAKNHFSELVDRALSDGPQTVTRHGEPVVVVIPYSEFRRRSVKRDTLVEFFARSPLRGADLDLSRPEPWDREL
jgi:prevent-host-death family protein